jgi:hypothetical protein
MRRIAFMTSVVLVGAFVGCVSIDDNARGVRDAKKRIQKGELVKTIPMGFYSFSDETPEYWRILRERYGIRHEMTMGKSEEYVQGFDSVMKPEIDRRFDGEFFDRIWKEAVEQHAKKTQE